MYSYENILSELNGYNTEKAKEMLKANIREEGAKSRVSSKKYKIIERVTKADNVLFSKAHKQNDGRYAFLESYRIFFSDDPLGYEVEEEKPFDASAVLRTEFTTSAVLDVDDIYSFIKIKGLRRNNVKGEAYFLKTEDGTIIGFNPYGLLDMIDYSGCNEILCSGKRYPAITKDGSAILLPVINDMDEMDFEVWRKNTFEKGV